MAKEHLLFLVHRIPYPPNKGDKIRSWHILKNLSESYHVHVGGFIDHEPDWTYVRNVAEVTESHFFRPLSPFWAKVKSLKGFLTGKSLTEGYYDDSQMASWVKMIQTKHQIRKVYVFSSSMASYIMNEGWLGTTKVMDFVDVDSDKWHQYAQQKSFPLSWIYRRESQYLARFEQKVAASCDANLFVSEKERDFFSQYLTPEHPEKNYAVPNGIDFSFWDPSFKTESPYPEEAYPIVFSGAMDYWPNVDAVQWFAKEIMPRLRAKIPNVCFVIVGSNPTDIVKSLQQDDVLVTGSVKDIRPYITSAKICVAPMRISRGIQNKVLEGMAMAKPVVATHIALSSLAKLKNEALVADSPEAFCEAILNLFNESERVISLGKEARAFIERECGWEKSFSLIRSFLK